MKYLWILPVMLCCLCFSLFAQENKKELPDLRSGEVSIPCGDFKKILDQAAPKAEEAPRPPVSFVLSRADYKGVVEGDTCRFKVLYKLSVLDDKSWSRIPLLGTSTALVASKFDGKDIVLNAGGEYYEFISNQKGEHEIALEFSVRINESLGKRFFEFVTPLLAGNSVEITVPDENVEIKVAASQQNKLERKNKTTVLTAFVPAINKLNVEWQQTTPEEEKGEPKIFLEINSIVSLGDNFVRYNAILNYNIMRAGLSDLTVFLPENVDVISVDGSGLNDWKVQKDQNRQKVLAKLSYKAKGEYRLSLSYEAPLKMEETSFKLDLPEVEGVERPEGFIGVQALTNLEVKTKNMERARNIDAVELSRTIRREADAPVLLAYKYLQTPTINLEISHHKDVEVLVTAIDSADIVMVQTPSERRIVRAVYNLRNNRSQYLRFELPANAVVWSSFRDGEPVKPAIDKEGKLLIPLKKSESVDADELSSRDDDDGEEQTRKKNLREKKALKPYTVEIVYVQDCPAPKGEKGEYSAELPATKVPISQVKWALFLPEEYAYENFEGSVKRVANFSYFNEEGLIKTNKSDQYKAYKNVRGELRKERKALDQLKKVQQDLHDSKAAKQVEAIYAVEGVLPVKVLIPQKGRFFQFEKYLVIGDPLEIKTKFQLDKQYAEEQRKLWKEKR